MPSSLSRIGCSLGSRGARGLGESVMLEEEFRECVCAALKGNGEREDLS